MDTFKSKLKLVNDNVDTLSYIRHSNDSVNISTDLKMKEGNYNINNIKAVSSSKDINMSFDRLTGKGVNTLNNINNKYSSIDKMEDVNDCCWSCYRNCVLALSLHERGSLAGRSNYCISLH